MSELKATRITMVYDGEVYEDFETAPCTQRYYRKSEADNVIAEKDKEIRRLHRCVIRMTRQWLGAIDEMYSRLDDVHGLDDDDVEDWEKVSHLRKNLKKVLEKWK